jgi:Cu2+-containing amine oxidase
MAAQDSLTHPLATLTPAEVDYACASFSAAATGTRGGLTFYEVCVHETATSAQKERALAGHEDALPERRALIVACDPQRRLTLMGNAPVAAGGALPALAPVPRAQPAMSQQEYAFCERLVMAHPEMRSALARRGIDPAHVRVDPWCVGWHSPADNPSRRLAEPILFVQERPEDNLYARSLEGLRLRIDLWAEPPRVVEFEELDGAPPLPPAEPFMNFQTGPAPRAVAAPRPPLAPLRYAPSPGGPGFRLTPDGRLSWQHWEAVMKTTVQTST